MGFHPFQREAQEERGSGMLRSSSILSSSRLHRKHLPSDSSVMKESMICFPSYPTVCPVAEENMTVVLLGFSSCLWNKSYLWQISFHAEFPPSCIHVLSGWFEGWLYGFVLLYALSLAVFL
ncbi:hypothetical protein CDAR_454631 [Caerostris darwini]|uniref:Uncharacterized protein n=1 Tax=Caerostris darwini TaxID=1538125 RepID=A0AAV4TVW8_9ARAC|nr:hypothetical protein CDAR_454631 [Caerostris darwini]